MGEGVARPGVDEDGLERNPRYRVQEFHSEILPDDRAVMVYLPVQYLDCSIWACVVRR